MTDKVMTDKVMTDKEFHLTEQQFLMDMIDSLTEAQRTRNKLKHLPHLFRDFAYYQDKIDACRAEFTKNHVTQPLCWIVTEEEMKRFIKI